MTDDRPSAARSPSLPTNVLVTAAGRRTSLVRAFRAETRLRGGRTIAGDVDGLAPALYLADAAVRLLQTDDPGYVDDLLGIVARDAIRLVVPTIDPELPVLARSEAAFRGLGCIVAISSERFVEITGDKHETVVVFGDGGVRVPRSWLPPLPATAALPARLFIKPRAGSASQNVHHVARSELDRVLPLVPDPIVQEVLNGPEITIDALLDLSGQPLHYVPRRRIRTLAGESIQGVTLERDRSLEAWIEGVLTRCAELGARGPLTLQAFLTDDGPVLSEVNPRFGGGFPLALAAGGRYPAWLLDLVEGEPVTPRLGEYKAGLYMSRYAVERFIRRPKW